MEMHGNAECLAANVPSILTTPPAACGPWGVPMQSDILQSDSKRRCPQILGHWVKGTLGPPQWVLMPGDKSPPPALGLQLSPGILSG